RTPEVFGDGDQSFTGADGHRVVLTADKVDAQGARHHDAKPASDNALGIACRPVTIENAGQFEPGALDGFAHAGKTVSRRRAGGVSLDIKDLAAGGEELAKLAALNLTDLMLIGRYEADRHLREFLSQGTKIFHAAIETDQANAGADNVAGDSAERVN